MNTTLSALLDVPQGAKQLNISPHTLRSWLRGGRLRFVRLGRRVLIRPQDLERFVTDHVVTVQGPDPTARGVVSKRRRT